jgi:hypothetical protein
MGLDDFSSGSTSTTTSTGGASGKQKNKQQSSSGKKVSDNDTSKPYFTAAIDTRYDSVRVMVGKRAFDKSSRFKYENILCVLPDEESFDRLNEISLSYTDKDLEKLFRTEPRKGEDLVNRFKNDDKRVGTVRCEVCGDDIEMGNDNYTKVFGEIVHATHNVEDVVAELDGE